MDLRELLVRHGGLSTRAALVAATSRTEVDRSVSAGVIVRVGRGRYALPEVDAAARTAHGVNGVLCLTSAALHHGWEVKQVPVRPHVVFPRNRRVPPSFREAVRLHRRDLTEDDVSGAVATSRELTLTQCLRFLSDDEALAIADSALRAGEDVTLRRVAATARGAGAAKVRRIASQARAGAANPFESCTRAISLRVPGLLLEPQVVIDTPHVWARPDLVDVDRRLVVECDSYEWHGSRAGFRKDVRRYTLLVADGWRVLRFTWHDVMSDPGYVEAVLGRVAADTRTEVPRARRAAA